MRFGAPPTLATFRSISGFWTYLLRLFWHAWAIQTHSHHSMGSPTGTVPVMASFPEQFFLFQRLMYRRWPSGLWLSYPTFPSEFLSALRWYRHDIWFLRRTSLRAFLSFTPLRQGQPQRLPSCEIKLLGLQKNHTTNRSLSWYHQGPQDRMQH